MINKVQTKQHHKESSAEGTVGPEARPCKQQSKCEALRTLARLGPICCNTISNKALTSATTGTANSIRAILWAGLQSKGSC